MSVTQVTAREAQFAAWRGSCAAMASPKRRSPFGLMRELAECHGALDVVEAVEVDATRSAA